ncbi:MAG TPA: hypothetical protein PLX88_05955 [Syntrophorhabdaceae bacterium]|jgi:molybdopterin converting factor small subunit|nr:hypothetical protein [Syntrophorhabdaceae bacterium]MDI9561310.1 hypothetical protein [Pseudomonadota bacterium]OQC51402.1 MAG: hypothetical protein BWX58_00267 [Deltaproteobacteria bacterium ADurb.Bin026]MBP8697582.1 hypothetical protein [Syntrophorhabdaceae bacterium]MBV6506856.1 hypothetical protein [Syntrophorhabdaceae bacterium]
MKINVNIDSNLRIRNVFEPPIRIDFDNEDVTLRDVLLKLKNMYPYLRFIEKGEMGDDLRHLYLNGENHFNFSEGLNRKVSEDDTVHVEAYLDPLAGG